MMEALELLLVPDDERQKLPDSPDWISTPFHLLTNWCTCKRRKLIRPL
jgi:hypothetical protein